MSCSKSDGRFRYPNKATGSIFCLRLFFWLGKQWWPMEIKNDNKKERSFYNDRDDFAILRPHWGSNYNYTGTGRFVDWLIDWLAFARCVVLPVQSCGLRLMSTNQVKINVVISNAQVEKRQSPRIRPGREFFSYVDASVIFVPALPCSILRWTQKSIRSGTPKSDNVDCDSFRTRQEQGLIQNTVHFSSKLFAFVFLHRF